MDFRHLEILKNLSAQKWNRGPDKLIHVHTLHYQEKHKEIRWRRVVSLSAGEKNDQIQANLLLS